MLPPPRVSEEMEEVLTQAKSIIAEEMEKAGCRLRRLILFGSRAHGNAGADSDWDFIAVVDGNLARSLRLRTSANIRRRLVFQGIVADILIYTEADFQQRTGDAGHIAHYAVGEGVEV